MKYRFEIIYSTKSIQEMANLMKALDLNLEEIGLKENITFTTKEDIPISVIKEKLHQALESESIKILSLEGGKVE